MHYFICSIDSTATAPDLLSILGLEYRVSWTLTL